MTEETRVTKYEEKASIEEIKGNVQLIQRVMQAVMKEGEHYGKIPGCGPKPTLLKPGAEKLSATFRLYPEIEILSEVDTPEEYTVKVRVRLVHGPSGIFCGSGVGACSSMEEKYGWRAAVCEEEWEQTPEERRRIKYVRREGQVQRLRQIRTEPKTQMNTVLKMAKKRAYVDAVLSATAASDLFTQDLEDMDLQPNGRAAAKPQPTKSASKKGDVQLGIAKIREILAEHYKDIDAGTVDEWIHAQWGAESLDNLTDYQTAVAIYKELMAAPGAGSLVQFALTQEERGDV